MGAFGIVKFHPVPDDAMCLETVSQVLEIDCLGNHPIFSGFENRASGRCFQFHCGRNAADGHVGPLIVVCP